MVDIENEVFTALAEALRRKFPKIAVGSAPTHSPPKFPFVCVEEADNYTYQRTRDSSGEKHSVVMYEINAYSSKASGRKAECKAIIAECDAVMSALGFTRGAKNPFGGTGTSGGTDVYRIFARYTAVVSDNETIYGR